MGGGVVHPLIGRYVSGVRHKLARNKSRLYMTEDFDWEAFEKECEEDQRELDELNQKMDEAFEWIDVFWELDDKLTAFNENMESLYQGITSAKQQENNRFLNGILLVGVVSSYESFVHDFFDACCTKQGYIAKALLNIDKLGDKDRKYLRLKIGMSEDSLKKRLKKVTLHDPIQIANIAELLFGLKMPILRQDQAEKLLGQRNLFTHHGGVSGDESVEITSEYLLGAYNVIYRLINGYVGAIKGHADEFMGQET